MRDRLMDLKETDNPWGNHSTTPNANDAAGAAQRNPSTSPSTNRSPAPASAAVPPPATTKKGSKSDARKSSSSPTSKAAAKAEQDMAAFFDQVAEIRDAIATIKTSILSIEEMHQKALTVISEEQSAATAKEMDKIMERTNKQASELRVKLKVMEAMNKKQAAEKGEEGDVKIKMTQHGVLTKNFLDVMMDYKAIQQKYQEKYKQRMERQFLVVKPNASKEEISQMMDGKNGPVFAQQIRMTGQKLEAKRALQDIQDRHQDVLRIEKSILELQQLFMDMSVMIDAQGEMLNTVEIHVSNALRDTEAGTKALGSALVLQKKTRRKMCIILVGLILLIGVIVIVVVKPYEQK